MMQGREEPLKLEIILLQDQFAITLTLRQKKSNKQNNFTLKIKELR